MKTFITSYTDWLEEYKKNKYNTWIRAILTNSQEIYLKEYSEWLDLKTYCIKNNLGIIKVGLQYRSHSIEVDLNNTDGAYLVRSILATFGQEEKQTYTIGKIIGSKVHKTIWIIPELIQHIEEEDTIEQCFEEAIIYNHCEKK